MNHSTSITLTSFSIKALLLQLFTTSPTTQDSNPLFSISLIKGSTLSGLSTISNPPLVSGVKPFNNLPHSNIEIISILVLND
jgi:hypothetical protein